MRYCTDMCLIRKSVALNTIDKAVVVQSVEISNATVGLLQNPDVSAVNAVNMGPHGTAPDIKCPKDS